MKLIGLTSYLLYNKEIGLLILQFHTSRGHSYCYFFNMERMMKHEKKCMQVNTSILHFYESRGRWRQSFLALDLILKALLVSHIRHQGHTHRERKRGSLFSSWAEWKQLQIPNQHKCEKKIERFNEGLLSAFETGAKLLSYQRCYTLPGTMFKLQGSHGGIQQNSTPLQIVISDQRPVKLKMLDFSDLVWSGILPSLHKMQTSSPSSFLFDRADGQEEKSMEES